VAQDEGPKLKPQYFQKKKKRKKERQKKKKKLRPRKVKVLVPGNKSEILGMGSFGIRPLPGDTISLE
jgi:hypothetical protein